MNNDTASSVNNFLNNTASFVNSSNSSFLKEQESCSSYNQDYYFGDGGPSLNHHLGNHYSLSSSPDLFRYHPGSSLHGLSSPVLARALNALNADKNRRPRGEKKPIPDEQKDDKYYERRRKNNEAAKKSRDARKQREDELAMRASHLERDNSILKVKIVSMREEAMKLRELWVAKCQGLAMGRQQNLQANQSSVPVSGSNQGR
ncbi:bZIP transcription factor 8-like [Physella acuta]|uniref:bZIP transcription factor 8-like n=1 Tax=Physella acuta TaxID=109671 RepID=UPI0027DE117E|nr:bZIP transcription factor 8-like [Physella acuta]